MGNLAIAISNIFSFINLIYLVFGVILGVIIGAIPGIGPAMVCAMVIPFTFPLDPGVGIAMLMGIQKGAIYGGSITAIMMHVPGTMGSIASMEDGYYLTSHNKAGKALKVSLYSSVMGDLISIVILIFGSVSLSLIAVKFGPAEFFSLVVLALTVLSVVSEESIVKGFISACMGALIASVGMDPITGSTRFAFGSIILSRGFDLLPVLIGMFAFSQMFIQMEKRIQKTTVKTNYKESVKSAENNISIVEWKLIIPHILRSTGIGAFVGALPGIGVDIAALLSYSIARKTAKKPQEFGKGSIEGLAAAEAGNSAVCGSNLIPLLSLGIPGDMPSAIVLGALIVHGIHPGPLLIKENPEVIYTLYVGLFVASLSLFFIAKIGLKYILRVLDIPQNILFSSILIICFIGTYSLNSNMFDLLTMVIFGILGYVMLKYKFSMITFVVSWILLPILETNFRQALLISKGSISIFFTHPISLFLLLFSFLAIIFLPKLAIKKVLKGLEYKG